jgi:WD40 repeat protein
MHLALTDNRTIATCGAGSVDGSVLLWDATTGCIIRTLRNPECDRIDSISISSNTSFLVTLGLNKAQVRGVAARSKKQPDGEWVIDASRVFDYPWSYRSDTAGLHFAQTQGDSLVVFDFHGNETRIDLYSGLGKLSPDGNWLAGGVWDGALKICDAASGKIVSTTPLSAPRSAVVCVSPDGSMIIVDRMSGLDRMSGSDQS